MDEKIKQLLDWCVTDYQPAFYDVESATAIEQTGILHEKIKELINEYHDFIFKSNEFKNYLIKIIHNYIHMMDDKINLQDLKIEKNLSSSIEELLNELVNNGELENIITTYEYNPSLETLTLKMGGAK